MATRPFSEISAGDPSLLETVEGIVIESHRRLYERLEKQWSLPLAYQWLHYEDPMPVKRLAEGVERLAGEGATFDAAAVDKACAQGVARGFSN